MNNVLDNWDNTWCRYYGGFTQSPPDRLIELDWFRPEVVGMIFCYPDTKGQLKQFSGLEDWHNYVLTLRLKPSKIPLPHIDSFDDALRALVMSYFFSGLSKVAESKALSALEDALKVAYQHKMCTTDKQTGEHKCHLGLGGILNWLAQQDEFYKDMADTEKGHRRQNALNVIRDKQMHGNQSEVMPWGGLFEKVKQTIEHAFHNWAIYDLEWFPKMPCAEPMQLYSYGI